VPCEGVSLDMDHEKTSIMGYRTLFEGSGIHNSNSGQLTDTRHVQECLHHATL